MSIRIGGGVGGRYSRPIKGITSYENRILQDNEHSFFWQDSKFCIDNGIYLIVNIDTYMTDSRWMPTNLELREFTIETMDELMVLGATKDNCRFTWDNESLEYDPSVANYYGKLRVIHDALNGQFDLGAGNFRTSQLPAYAWIASKYNEGYYEVFDIHYQDGMNDKYSIESIALQFRIMVLSNGIKRSAVTEGNNFWNVSTADGHGLLCYQIATAEGYGVEDFCFPFVNWTLNSEEGHSMMSYNVDDGQISGHWPDMLRIIKEKKPIVEGSSDGMILPSTKLGTTGYLTELTEELLDHLGYTINKIDAKFDASDVAALKAFQTAIKDKYPNIVVDGICGRKGYFYLIKEIPDSMDRGMYEFKLQVLGSPVK